MEGELVSMTNDEQQVRDNVRIAFRGVQLGAGIGLRQGEGMDDYADEATLQKHRLQDESLDWSNISVTQLNECSASLSYMDKEGVRFHLPAYVIADLEGSIVTQDILFQLCHLSQGAEERFDLLNSVQRESIRQFLQLRLKDPNYRFQSSMIQNALEQYWNGE